MEQPLDAAVARCLLAAARRRDPLTYTDLAEQVGSHPRSLRGVLGRIQGHCRDADCPDLTALVVSKTTGLPGGMFFLPWLPQAADPASRRRFWESMCARVYAFGWAEVAPRLGLVTPSAAAPDGDAPPPLLAVLGHPVAHSLSPVMHEAGFAARGRRGRYIACDVTVAGLPAAVAGLAALGFLGCNLTVSLKEAGCALATHRSPEAARTGAANTLAFRAGGEVYADTTDGRGLLRSLAEAAGWEARGRRVVLLGAGGAARGVAAALLAAGAALVTVANRTPERAGRLATDIGGAIRGIGLLPEPLAVALSGADLLVNCTTVGMHGRGMALPVETLAALPRGAVVCDIVYAPEETPLLAAARAGGWTVVGGLGMLAWQAALAWEVWFGETGPAQTFALAARRALP